MALNLITPAASAGGNIAVSTSPSGSGGSFFGNQELVQLTICNDTGVTLEFRQGGSGQWVPIFDGTYFSILGITNANQIDIRRKDQSTTTVAVKARWEA